ncbi:MULTISPECIES: hypothetical protein [Paenibacillus]|uniref:Lipoprotein YajG n=1 Tax=Paenibacillus brasilensis TaxID=128574 RepID=A0ABU0KU51_9BACL|nr:MULTISPECIES: hypothetical protein [Paenibacillus]MDQ0492809.1 putative lipoprotein YajG [Paenibacillus brasilensis]
MFRWIVTLLASVLLAGCSVQQDVEKTTKMSFWEACTALLTNALVASWSNQNQIYHFSRTEASKFILKRA